LRSNGRILAVDIGAGTQDILLYEDGIPVENCVKLVIPSATSMVAGKIARATAAGKDIFLAGHLMGGGSSVKAMKNHLAAGLHVYATSAAAKTVRDDPREVESMGVEIVDGLPNNDCEKIELRDMDLNRLGKALSFFDVSLPDVVAVAVQDHGEIIGRSNRKFRFEHLENSMAGFRKYIVGQASRIIAHPQPRLAGG
jgi:uncharacterized protein (DUF1786 family)